MNDSTGAAVANAQVTVIGEQAQFARVTLTGAAGDYSFTEVPLGIYKMGAEKSGRGTNAIPTTATQDVSGGNPCLGGGGRRNFQLAVKFQF
jgi:hypothetical protein